MNFYNTKLKNSSYALLFTLSVISSQNSWAEESSSMCEYIASQGVAKCTNSQDLLGSKENLDKNFTKYDGYHHGNNEQQVYKTDHVRWNNSDNTVSLLTEAKPTDGYPFTSGELKTQKKFTITRDTNNKAIQRGGVEVTAKVPYDYGR